MCGIVGCVGKTDVRKFLIDGLRSLDYRGYDSAGIAYANGKSVKVVRTVGSVDKLNEKVTPSFVSNLGIGHTRWATHGAPSLRNCHPVSSLQGRITLVHNGVIENYMDLKRSLTQKGYSFKGETDSEVIASLLEENYLVTQNIKKAIVLTMESLQGSYACAFIFKGDLKHLYLFRQSSPLLIGESNEFTMCGSDAVPLLKYTDKVIEMENGTFAILSEHSVELFDMSLAKVTPHYTKKEPIFLQNSLGGYPNYMLKEIEEIEHVIRRLCLLYYKDGGFDFQKGLIHELNRADTIIFIGCGTAYHASLVGSRYFQAIGKDSPVFIASEWAYYPAIPGKKPFAIFLSQSGETADTIRCLNIIHEHGIKCLVITNTKGSALERLADYSILLEAGLEVSVASTKAYAAMVTALAMLTKSLSSNHEVIRDLNQCCKINSDIKNTFKPRIQALAEKLKDKPDIFFLGRGYDYDLALEASLKLKEISYIHSEAIAGGELKHGPIALMAPGVPVLVLITDPITAKAMRNNILEVKARGADVYVVSTDSLHEEGDYLVVEDYKNYLSSVAICTVAFYFAYFVSCAKGLNVDKPRNLAKAVTVE